MQRRLEAQPFSRAKLTEMDYAFIHQAKGACRLGIPAQQKNERSSDYEKA